MGKRCLTKATLCKIAYGKKWKGRVSVTDCLRGTMELFLRYTKDWYANPKWFAYMLLGISHHSILEEAARNNIKNALVEKDCRMEDDDIVGVLDIVEPDDEEPDKYCLTDYKTWGSFQVAKALGITKIEVPDPEGGIYSRGPRKGMPRTIEVTGSDPAKSDMHDTELQLNRYRMGMEKRGFPISNMAVQATVRDGNTRSAKDRGVTDTMYLFDVKRLDDSFVEEFFIRKRDNIIKAMNDGKWDEPCSDRECWDGQKCRQGLTMGYCPVANFCPKGAQLAEYPKIQSNEL
jgi:hypothetical protein